MNDTVSYPFSTSELVSFGPGFLVANIVKRSPVENFNLIFLSFLFLFSAKFYLVGVKLLLLMMWSPQRNQKRCRFDARHVMKVNWLKVKTFADRSRVLKKDGKK